MNQQDRIISRDDLRRIVPAAFALGPSDNVSDRYSFISTEKLIDQMADRGWAPVGGMQQRSRKPENRMSATHSIFFEKIGQTLTKVGGLVGRVMLFNNHAGRMARKLLSGFLRLICLNGLVVDSGIAGYADRRVHKGVNNFALDEALAEATGRLDNAQGMIEEWKDIQLSYMDRVQFANEALTLRNPDAKPIMSTPLLDIRRDEDHGNDLWTVFNRVQENLVQGGVRGIFHPRRTLRAIRGVTSNQELNQGLWALATRFAVERQS
jgi:hypothetical protein